MEILLPLLVYGLVGLLTVYICAMMTEPNERGPILRVMLLGLALRLALAILFSMVPATRSFHEDANGYEWLGAHLAAGWNGSGPPLLRPDTFNQGYVYLCGAASFLVGGSRYAPAFLNTVFGTLTVFLVYRLARHFFHAMVARRAAVCCAFFPSMVLWSSISIKDPLMSLLIVTSLIGCVRLKQQVTISSLLITVLPVVATQPVRFYMVYFLGFSIGASFLIERGGRRLSGFPKVILIVGAVLGLLVSAGFAGHAEAGIEMLSFERVSGFRQGMATTADSGFDANADVSTPARALAFIPLGVAMLLFSPFPWQFTSLRSTFALPEMLVWWYMVPALWRGLRYVVKTRLAECSPILLFAITLTAGYSLMQGNIGSGFRQRAQIFIFLFIFTAVGEYVGRCRRMGIPPEALLVEKQGDNAGLA